MDKKLLPVKTDDMAQVLHEVAERQDQRGVSGRRLADEVIDGCEQITLTDLEIVIGARLLAPCQEAQVRIA